MARWDIAHAEIRYSNAGHPSPLHVQRQAGLVQPLCFSEDSSGPALGVMEESTYATDRCPLSVNDLVVLFTDGLYEVEGHSVDYDEERLITAIQQRIQLPAPELFDELLAEIQQFSVSGEFEDDVCLVGMEIAQLGQ